LIKLDQLSTLNSLSMFFPFPIFLGLSKFSLQKSSSNVWTLYTGISVHGSKSWQTTWHLGPLKNKVKPQEQSLWRLCSQHVQLSNACFLISKMSHFSALYSHDVQTWPMDQDSSVPKPSDTFIFWFLCSSHLYKKSLLCIFPWHKTPSTFVMIMEYKTFWCSMHCSDIEQTNT
jgi:hypothetical protein